MDHDLIKAILAVVTMLAAIVWFFPVLKLGKQDHLSSLSAKGVRLSWTALWMSIVVFVLVLAQLAMQTETVLERPSIVILPIFWGTNLILISITHGRTLERRRNLDVIMARSSNSTAENN